MVDWRESLLLFQIENKPLSKPGVYGLYNWQSKKWYIGMSKYVSYRLESYENYKESQHCLGPFIYKALCKYGSSAFIVVPLFYFIVTPTIPELLEVESKLIENYDSINNGYNIQQYWNGTYGKAHSNQIKFALAEPKTRKAHLEALNRIAQDPKVNEKRSASHKGRAIGRISVTNGILNKNLPAGSAIPEGWQRGRIVKKGYKWKKYRITTN